MFDGVLKPGKNVDQTILTFNAQLTAPMGKVGCLEAVESPIPTKIGREECSEAALKAEFWEGLMTKALTAWNMLKTQIPYPTTVQQIAEAGSPTGTWAFFLKRYAR